MPCSRLTSCTIAGEGSPRRRVAHRAPARRRSPRRTARVRGAPAARSECGSDAAAPRSSAGGPTEGALVGVAHLHREVADVRGRIRQQLEQAQVGGSKRFMVRPGRPVRRRPRGAMRSTRRPTSASGLAETWQAGVAGAHTTSAWRASGTATTTASRSRPVRPRRLVQLGDGERATDGTAHRSRGVGQRHQLDPILLIPQEVHVRSLADEAGTHEPDAQTASPRLPPRSPLNVQRRDGYDSQR